jgi:hypothetical protein
MEQPFSCYITPGGATFKITKEVVQDRAYAYCYEVESSGWGHANVKFDQIKEIPCEYTKKDSLVILHESANNGFKVLKQVGEYVLVSPNNQIKS